jgi:hypothetical protein
VGAFSGAALLGIPTYLSKEIRFFGPERNMALLAASISFVVGIIAGTQAFAADGFQSDVSVSESHFLLAIRTANRTSHQRRENY